MKLPIYIILLILLSSITLAIPPFSYSCNDTGMPSNLRLLFDPYIGIGELRYIYAAYLTSEDILINESGVSSNITLVDFYSVNDNTSYNMSFSNSSRRWYILLNGSAEENINFTIRAISPGYICQNSTDNIIKSRQNFTVRIKFFKAISENDSIGVDPYLNEFQYVYLELYDYNIVHNIYLQDTSYLSSIDNFLVSWWPWYKRSFTQSSTMDTSIVHWGHYTDGAAYINVYELSNYSLNILGVKAYNPLGWSYEFIKPQYASNKFDSSITYLRFTSNVSSNNNYDVILSTWEMSKSYFFMNMLKIVMLWVIYIGISIAAIWFGGPKGLIIAAILFPILWKLT